VYAFACACASGVFVHPSIQVGRNGEIEQPILQHPLCKTEIGLRLMFEMNKRCGAFVAESGFDQQITYSFFAVCSNSLLVKNSR
jgi:hypothetical protein